MSRLFPWVAATVFLVHCKPTGGGGDPGDDASGDPDVGAPDTGSDPDSEYTTDGDPVPAANCPLPLAIDAIPPALDDLLVGRKPLRAVITGAAVEENPDVGHAGYLTLRFDVPALGCASPLVPVVAFAAIGESGIARAHAAYPGMFTDQRVQLRAEYARRLRHAKTTLASALPRFLDELDAIPAPFPDFPVVKASSCSTVLDPEVPCADDVAIGEPFGLVVDAELTELRGFTHEIPSYIASDLLIGRLASEGRWDHQLVLPIPDDSARDYLPLKVAVTGRVHLRFHAMQNPEKAGQSAFLFDPFDLWATIAIGEIAHLDDAATFSTSTLADDRYADHEAQLAGFRALESSSTFDFRTLREERPGCW